MQRSYLRRLSVKAWGPRRRYLLSVFTDAPVRLRSRCTPFSSVWGIFPHLFSDSLPGFCWNFKALEAWRPQVKEILPPRLKQLSSLTFKCLSFSRRSENTDDDAAKLERNNFIMDLIWCMYTWKHLRQTQTVRWWDVVLQKPRLGLFTWSLTVYEN